MRTLIQGAFAVQLLHFAVADVEVLQQRLRQRALSVEGDNSNHGWPIVGVDSGLLVPPGNRGSEV